MALKKLTAVIVLCEFIGLGVFFAALLGLAVSQGGTLTIDMTQFGEMWLEYWILLILMAVVPYVLYSVENITFR